MSIRTIETPDNFRNNVKKQLDNLLKDEKNSANLEKGIFNYSLKEAANRKVIKKWDNPYFVQIYKDKLWSVYVNLKKNPTLIEQVTQGNIKSHTIAFMTHQEMDPERWRTLNDSKIKRDKHKFESNIEAATDTFTCRKCRKNQCTYYQMQTRSADEPMTTFVQCIPCGNRWKC
jgi:transcription elongation factor S-II